MGNCCETHLYDTTLEAKNRGPGPQRMQFEYTDSSPDLLLRNTVAPKTEQRAMVTFKRSQARLNMNNLLNQNETMEEIKESNNQQRDSNDYNFSKRNTLISAYWKENERTVGTNKILPTQNDQQYLLRTITNENHIDMYDKDDEELLNCLNNYDNQIENSQISPIKKHQQYASDQFVDDNNMHQGQEHQSKEIASDIIEKIQVVSIEEVYSKMVEDDEFKEIVKVYPIKSQQGSQPYKIIISFTDCQLVHYDIRDKKLKLIGQCGFDDVVIAMEQYNIPKQKEDDIIMIVLDLSNRFHLYSILRSKIILTDDRAAKLNQQVGTYSDILRILTSQYRGLFISTLWNSENNFLEIRETVTFNKVQTIQFKQHINEVIEIESQKSQLYGCIAIGMKNGEVLIFKLTNNNYDHEVIRSFRINEEAMILSVQGICEYGLNGLCIQSDSRFYIWDYVKCEFALTLDHSDEQLSKVISVRGEENESSEVLISIDIEGFLQMWDSTSISEYPNKPMLQLSLKDSDKYSPKKLNTTEEIEIKDLVQISQGIMAVIEKNSIKLIHLKYSLTQILTIMT